MEKREFKYFINTCSIKTLQVFAVLLLLRSLCSAEIKLPALIADGMVLQQKTNVTLWGWAKAGEKIDINGNWAKTTYHALADAKGEWKVSIPTPAASTTAYSIFFNGDGSYIQIKNVVFGEVWLCSGQSNMEFTMAKGRAWMTGVNDYETEVAKVNNPLIRHFTVNEVASGTPKTDTKGDWQEANPTNVRTFSAIAYYYAREIFAKTGFPIGLINATWGGTPAEAWTKKEVMQADPDLKVIVDNYEKRVAGNLQVQQDYNDALTKWKADTAAAKQQQLTPPKAPVKPAAIGGNSAPAYLYNGMIAPILNYTIKGVIWYQGESNATKAWQYRKLFPAMIKGWRDDYHNPDMPFYFIQLSPHYTENGVIREAQLYTYQTVPHTGMVVTTDNGDSALIHPRNKEIVGKRLALWPLSHDYGFKDIAYSGPIYRSMKAEGKQIRLNFDEVGEGLMAKDGDLTEFTVAGADHVFHAAQAKIDGNTVVVSSQLVDKPVAVRFAYRAVPLPNFYNKAGLPATPFRTDNWPVITQGVN